MVNKVMQDRGRLGGRPKRTFGHLKSSPLAQKVADQALLLEHVFPRAAWLSYYFRPAAEHVAHLVHQSIAESEDDHSPEFIDRISFAAIRQIRGQEIDRSIRLDTVSVTEHQFKVERTVCEVAELAAQVYREELY